MPHTNQKNTLLPTLAMLFVCLGWSATFAVTKTAVGYLKPEFVVLCRMALGAVIFMFCWKKLRTTKIIHKDIPLLLLMILFEPCLFFLMESYALTFTSASQAGMIVATSPLFTALAAWIFLREKPSLLMWIGFSISIFGIFLLSFDSAATEYAPNPVLGNILQVLCMCCGAGFVICIKKLGARYPPFFLAALQAFAGTAFFLLVNIVRGISIPSSIELTPLFCLIYLGIGVTFIGISLFNYGVSKLPAATSAGLLNLVPFLAVLIGAIFLGEELNPMQWLAGALVIAGVLLSQKAKVKLAPPEKLKDLPHSSLSTKREGENRG